MKFELYPDQKECVEACLNHLVGNDPQPGVALCPTGYGKTLVISELAVRLGGGLLVLHLGKELLEQNLEKLQEFGGKATVYSAALDSKEVSTLTFGTLASVKKQAKAFKDIGIKYVVIDECDRNFSPRSNSMFSNFVKELKPKSVIGLTATPWFLSSSQETGPTIKMITDCRPNFFKKFIYISQIQEMVEKERWTPINYEVYNFDRSGLKLNTTGSDFTPESIIEQNKIQGVNNNMYLRVKELLEKGAKSILVFVDSLANCEKFANLFPNDSAYLNAKSKDRGQIISDFKSGKLKVIFNYGVLSVGFNFPGLQYIMLGRSSNSLSWYYQVVGRGVRRAKDKKVFTLIDLGGNLQKFGRIELLRVQMIEGWGMSVTSEDRVLTKVPLGLSEYTIEDVKRIATTSRKKEYIDKNIYFWFGKHQNKDLSRVPVFYLKWWVKAKEGDTLTNKEQTLYDEVMKVIRNKSKF